jgi:hypothetical protein
MDIQCSGYPVNAFLYIPTRLAKSLGSPSPPCSLHFIMNQQYIISCFLLIELQQKQGTAQYTNTDLQRISL